MSKLLDEVCIAQTVFADIAGINLVWKKPHHPAYVNGDRDLVYRILQNLIGNAIKFSDKGSTVNCFIQPMGDEMVIAVKDNGPGIPGDTLNKIFDKFYQVKNKSTGVKRGVGLGLAFCKMATEAQNGRIWIESQVGVGSVFKVALKVIS